MFGFIKSLFGPRPQNILPPGVRDVVEFAWTEPHEEGQPPASDIARLVASLTGLGWGQVTTIEHGYAVNIEGDRANVHLEFSVGHNGEGPWVAFVEFMALEDSAHVGEWMLELHDMLGALGATDLRWYERMAHDRGEGRDPWPGPIA